MDATEILKNMEIRFKKECHAINMLKLPKDEAIKKFKDACIKIYGKYTMYECYQLCNWESCFGY